MTQHAAKGPKQKRNPEKTRAGILEAGISLFSERGFTGVSVDEIVDKAGCNKRMLYHYFGNKDGLYVAVLKNVFARLEVLEMDFFREIDDPEECLNHLLQQYLDFLEGCPEFVRLLMWENLNGGSFIDRHPEILTKSPVMRAFENFLKRAAKAGHARKGLNARHLLIQLYSVPFIYQSNQHTLTRTLDFDLHDPKRRRRGVAQATNLLLHGLLAD